MRTTGRGTIDGASAPGLNGGWLYSLRHLRRHTDTFEDFYTPSIEQKMPMLSGFAAGGLSYFLFLTCAEQRFRLALAKIYGRALRQ
jgi:hypothetical protein